MNQEQATRKSYGPFPLKAAGTPVPSEFFNLPWSAVRRANLLVALADDIDTNPATAANLLPQMMLGVELSLVGVIQGYETVLKCQFFTGRTGGFTYLFSDEEGYEYVSFRQRMMNGGRPMSPPYGSNAAAQASLATVGANIYVMPRTGFAKVTNG